MRFASVKTSNFQDVLGNDGTHLLLFGPAKTLVTMGKESINIYERNPINLRKIHCEPVFRQEPTYMISA